MAYLVLHRDAHHSRQHLAFLFWPNVPEAQARNSLRQTVHHLRSALPHADHFLQVDASTLQWRAQAPLNLDVSEFTHAVATGDAAEGSGDRTLVLSASEHAVALYRGDLLPSCYDDWIEAEREQLRQQYQRVLQRLIHMLEEQRSYAAAIDHAERLLQYDPLREASHRCLMRLHALNDDRASGLRVYHTCVTTLQRELAVAPSRSTRNIYERLLRVDPLASQPTAPSPAFVAAVPLIGRHEAWEQVRAAGRRLAGGAPHCVTVCGEAGIGKSRLADELLRWADHQGMATARTRAYAAEGHLAYAPVAEWLRTASLRPALLGLAPVWLGEVARLLPELLTERPDLPRPERLTEHWQRQRFFQALARAVLAGTQPLVLLIDDLQWCDQETLEWLHYLLRFDLQARLLLVATARMEDVGAGHPLATLLADLRSSGQLTEIALGALGSVETAQLAAAVAGRELDQAEASRLFRETEGNPLFVVEIVRAGLLSADRRSPKQGRHSTPATRSPTPSGSWLPPRVHGVITARLAQLSAPARELVSLAATVGRAFTLDVLARASDGDEDSLVRGLDELWHRRIVREHGTNTYDFSHDKIREVAYAEVSAVHRPLLHRRVAQALEAVYGANLDSVSAQVAAHYEYAGMADRAIVAYHRAAEVSQRLYADDEAIRLLTAGLALLQSLPPAQERDARELALRMALGVSLVTTRGYWSAEVMAVYRRSLLLCQRLGQPPSPPALRALAIASVARGELQQAHDLGEQLLSLVECDQDSMLLVEAHYVLGVTLFWAAAFARSSAHLEQALAHYVPALVHTHIALYTQDPRVICLIRLAVDLWFLGYADQSRQTRQESLTLAKELAHPFSLAYVLFWDAVLHHQRRDVHATRAQAEAAIALSQEHRLGIWQAMGTVLRGWAVAEQGSREAGVDLMLEGMAAHQAAGATYMRPYFLSLVAGQCGHLGKIEQGLALLSEALAAVDSTGERWYEADLYRQKGELLLLGGDDDDAAESAFLHAVAVARSQGAKTSELRAAASLARLWRRRDMRAEAHRMLAEIYSWFAEGYDAPHVADAGSLLEQP
ncbi:MAG TPA: AAA family ATPase [Ktedonobacterales bacterium]|nr:AAA family ATPase [Ktedonobacterales bacterium]